MPNQRKETKKIVTFWPEEELLEWLKDYAKDNDTNVSDVVLRVLDAHRRSGKRLPPALAAE